MYLLFLLGFLFAYLIIEIKNNSYGGVDTYSPDHKAHIQKLTRQAARWSTAANQDGSPMIAVLHANYGAGYLWALKDIASDEQIHSATGIDVKQFQAEIVHVQDTATRKMAGVCEDFVPEKDFLSAIAGES